MLLCLKIFACLKNIPSNYKLFTKVGGTKKTRRKENAREKPMKLYYERSSFISKNAKNAKSHAKTFKVRVSINNLKLNQMFFYLLSFFLFLLVMHWTKSNVQRWLHSIAHLSEENPYLIKFSDAKKLTKFSLWFGKFQVCWRSKIAAQYSKSII